VEASLATLTQPSTLNGLVRLGELAPMVSDTVAMGTDIADEWIADNLGGDELDARLKAGMQALLTLSKPSVLEAVSLFAEQAPKLQTAVGRAASLDDTVAMATDIADEWVHEHIGGDGLQERLDAGKEALLAATHPDVLGALSRVAAQAPQLERLATLGAQFDDTVAMATDIADDWVRENVGGDGLGERLEAAGHALRTVSDPEVVEALGALASLAPRLLKSATLAADLDDLVASVGEAMREPAKRVGPFGLLSALRDPDIQRGLGQALLVARRLGQSSSLLPVQHHSSGV
jgi:hypothetical protein